MERSDHIAIKLAVHDCAALVRSSTYVCTVGNQEGSTYEVLTTRLHAVKYYQNSPKEDNELQTWEMHVDLHPTMAKHRV